MKETLLPDYLSTAESRTPVPRPLVPTAPQLTRLRASEDYPLSTYRGVPSLSRSAPLTSPCRPSDRPLRGISEPSPPCSRRALVDAGSYAATTRRRFRSSFSATRQNALPMLTRGWRYG